MDTNRSKLWIWEGGSSDHYELWRKLFRNCLVKEISKYTSKANRDNEEELKQKAIKSVIDGYVHDKFINLFDNDNEFDDIEEVMVAIDKVCGPLKSVNEKRREAHNMMPSTYHNLHDYVISKNNALKKAGVQFELDRVEAIIKDLSSFLKTRCDEKEVKTITNLLLVVDQGEKMLKSILPENDYINVVKGDIKFEKDKRRKRSSSVDTPVKKPNQDLEKLKKTVDELSVSVKSHDKMIGELSSDMKQLKDWTNGVNTKMDTQTQLLQAMMDQLKKEPQPMRRSKSEYDNRRTWKEKRCYHCNEAGHFIRDCPKKGQQPKN